MPEHTTIDTTQLDVLQAVRKRLLQALPEVSESCVFLTLGIAPFTEQRQALFFTITPTDGSFSEPELVGGGANAVLEQSGVAITVWTRCSLDRQDSEEAFLSHETRSIFLIKKKILEAFTGHMLQDDQGNDLLASHMLPISSPRPDHDHEDLGSLTLTFSTDFFWRLTAE